MHNKTPINIIINNKNKIQEKTEKTPPFDQSRRLSLRRPSNLIKGEIIEKENFIDIKDLLKPVLKDKAKPQKGEESVSNLTKVKSPGVTFYKFCVL